MTSDVFICLLAINMVVVLPSFVPARGKYELDDRIVGGSETTIDKYPYVVSLWMTDAAGNPQEDTCGGSVISEYWILTAGHCTQGVDASRLYIKAGDAYRRNGTKHEVSQNIVHPNYVECSDGSVDYDIALLKLKTPVAFSSNLKAVSLPPEGAVLKAGTMVSVVGWGSTDEMGDRPEVLNEVSVPVVSLDECTADNGRDVNNATMLCAGYQQGGKDSCGGDSGGPLVTNSTQVGIVSWGYGCAEPKKPGVYTNVAFFRDWIKKNTGT